MHAMRLEVTEEIPASADIVIIGGGIVGAATSMFAAKVGLKAVVLERRPALSTLTTPASTGAFRLQFDNPEELALVRETVGIFDDFAGVTGLEGYDIGIHHQGYLFCTTDEATIARQKALLARQQSWGLADVEWLSGDEARVRFPYLSPDVVGARWRAGDGWLDVRKLAAGYALAAQVIGGAEFVVNAEVIGFEMDAGEITGVRTSRGDIKSRIVVIAAGPFSGVVGAMAEVDIPLNLVRRQKMVMPDVPEVPQDAPMTIDEDTGAHWRPALRGAFCLRTVPGVPPGPPLDDVPISADFAFGLLDPLSYYALARISPFWRGVWERGTAHWMLQAGQYAYSVDHRPYLGTTGVPGLFVNCGYSGHGIMTSGAGSRIVVDAITGQLKAEDNPFRLERDVVEREHDVL
ncbi:MAG: FAD-dependent oxidoreductase [Chloroflexia bacterium]